METETMTRGVTFITNANLIFDNASFTNVLNWQTWNQFDFKTSLKSKRQTHNRNQDVSSRSLSDALYADHSLCDYFHLRTSCRNSHTLWHFHRIIRTNNRFHCQSASALQINLPQCITQREILSVVLLTRLMRRLIAYSWVQMHSHGSKPPSAISHQQESTLKQRHFK